MIDVDAAEATIMLFHVEIFKYSFKQQKCVCAIHPIHIRDFLPCTSQIQEMAHSGRHLRMSIKKPSQEEAISKRK